MKNQRLTYYFYLVLITTNFIAIKNTFSQTEDAQSIFQAMYDQELPSLIVQANFGALEIKGVEEVKATLKIEGLEKENWQIKLATRGKYRRRVCSFVPLTLNFKKGDLRDVGYLPFDDIKVITHCTDPELGIENVYKEYLAYELYNHITPNSFKAKMISIKYIDSLNTSDTISSLAVLLEPNKEMAHRLGGKVYDKWNLLADSLIPDNYTTMAMFQFMIGNHDWSLEMHRNIKCLYLEDIGKYMIIPYDFDFSGLVSPDYYVMQQDLPLTHPKDRLYMGAFFEEQIPAVAENFLGKKEAINTHCKGFELLPVRSRKEINRYINDFCKLLKKKASKIKFHYRLDYNVY